MEFAASSSARPAWLYPLMNAGQALFLAFWSVLWISVSLFLRVVTLDTRAPLGVGRHLWAPGLRWIAGATIVRDPLPDADWSRPYVYVLNHESMFDIVVAFIVLPSPVRFIAKKVLAWVPFLGWYMWATGMIFVDRRKHDEAVRSLDRACVRIREGASILAYPEGTRSRNGRILPFKKGPFVVAMRAGVPIVPVAIEGTARVLPCDGFRLRGGTIRVRIGTPIPTAGLADSDRDRLVRQVRDALIDLHVQIGGNGGDREDAVAAAGFEGLEGRSEDRAINETEEAPA